MTLGARGTLLYALEPFDNSAHIEMLVNFLIQGNYEVRHEVMNLVESIDAIIPEEIILKCVKKVKQEIKTLKEKQEFLTESLEILHRLKKG